MSGVIFFFCIIGHEILAKKEFISQFNDKLDEIFGFDITFKALNTANTTYFT